MLNYPAIKLVEGHYRKSPSGRTLWCGPFALAVITGLPYDTVYAKVLDVEKRRIRALNKAQGRAPNAGYRVPTSMQGLHMNALARTAERFGIKVAWKKVPKHGAKSVTLLTFAREHTVKDHVYVVIAGNHYETICNGVLYHSHHDPVRLEDAPSYRMAKVTYWADVKVKPAALASDESPLREALPSPRKDDRRMLFHPAASHVALQSAA